ncbi:hypothetical protein C8Q75DRAFT_809146 [Abortiporus biennis]|nr:hypothetical protein C8Q75DRAFT_809146 [Abortiporus biennis]
MTLIVNPAWHLSALRAEEYAFTMIAFSMFALYLWEFIISLDFDWEHLILYRNFKWPLLFYFVNRYLALISLGCLAFSRTNIDDCSSIYLFSSVSSAVCLSLSSLNLSIRAIAIWERNAIVVTILISLNIAFLVLIIIGSPVTTRWIPDEGCKLLDHGRHLHAAYFAFCVALDSIVLGLKIYKLVTIYDHHSKLGRILFSDGIIYFGVAMLFNIASSVLAAVDIDEVTDKMVPVPAMVFSTIAATRAVRHLSNYGEISTQFVETNSRFWNSDFEAELNGNSDVSSNQVVVVVVYNDSASYPSTYRPFQTNTQHV